MPLLQFLSLLPRVCGWSVPECSEQVFGLSGKLQPLQRHSVSRLPSWFLPQLQLVPQVQRELLGLLDLSGLFGLQRGVLPELECGLQQLSVVLGERMPGLQLKRMSLLRNRQISEWSQLPKL